MTGSGSVPTVGDSDSLGWTSCPALVPSRLAPPSLLAAADNAALMKRLQAEDSPPAHGDVWTGPQSEPVPLEWSSRPKRLDLMVVPLLEDRKWLCVAVQTMFERAGRI